MQAPHHKLPPWLWLLLPLAALDVLHPMLLHGFSCGHDLTFHLTNWFEAARQWHQGILYPRWATQPNWTAGEPRLIFYPPLSWMLGAAIAQSAGGAAAPFVYIFLVLCAAGVAMYRFARLTLLPATAFAAALLYVANPYMLFVIYTRSAYSELLAAAVLPLLFLAILRPRVHIARVAETVAVLWLSSAPGAVIGMYSLFVLAILGAWRHRNAANLLRAAAGTALGLGVAAIYIVPAAHERGWVQIGRAVSAGYNFQKNFLFAHTTEPLHDATLRQASWIAVALLLCVAACVAFLLWQRTRWHVLQKRVFFILAILAAIIFLLLLPVTSLLWQYLPEMGYLQFPWRWLLAVAPIFALLVAAVLNHANRRRVPVGVAIIFTILMTGAGWHLFNQQCDSEDAPRSVIAQLRSGAGQAGTLEYTPAGADASALQPAAPHVWFYSVNEIAQTNPGAHQELPQHADIARWDATDKQFSVDLPQPSIAILQLMDYPAWRATLNGSQTQKAAPAASGQVQIALPAGHSDVEVKFVLTRDRLIGDCVSAFCLLLLVLVTWSERKHHRHPPSTPSS